MEREIREPRGTACGAHDFRSASQPKAILRCLVDCKPSARMNRFRKMAPGLFLGLLNFHAAGSAGHDTTWPEARLDEQDEIKFALDVQPFSMSKRLTMRPAGPVCGVDELHAEIGWPDGGSLRARQLYAAPLPRPPRVNLRFDATTLTCDSAMRCITRFFLVNKTSPGRSDAVAREDGFGLVFMIFIEGPFSVRV